MSMFEEFPIAATALRNSFPIVVHEVAIVLELCSTMLWMEFLNYHPGTIPGLNS